MTHVEWAFRPNAAHPVVICAFEGWNDGGEAATTAVGYLRDLWRARRFAVIDPEEFFDFQVNRPTVRLEDGDTRALDWPACEFFHAKAGESDVVLFLGVEPNVRWRAFCSAILDVFREVDGGVLLTLGAFLADVPHTLPAPVTASSSDPRWIGKLGIEPSRYEGPTGIVGVLHDAAAKGGVPSVSLWAAAPHYVASGVNPRAALALLEKVRELLGATIPTEDMERAAGVWEQQVQEAIAEDDNLVAYVRKLEQVATERGELGQIPSGEQLAQELERFLRQERGDTEG